MPGDSSKAMTFSSPNVGQLVTFTTFEVVQGPRPRLEGPNVYGTRFVPKVLFFAEKTTLTRKGPCSCFCLGGRLLM